MKKGTVIYWITFIGILLFLKPLDVHLKLTWFAWSLWVIGDMLLSTVVQMFYEKIKGKNEL